MRRDAITTISATMGPRLAEDNAIVSALGEHRVDPAFELSERRGRITRRRVAIAKLVREK